MATISSAALIACPNPNPSPRFTSLSSSSSVFFSYNVCNRAGLVLYADRPRRAKKRGLSCNCLFGLGVPELVVIAGVAALVFGPKQLPEVGRSIGKTVKSFQQSVERMNTFANSKENDETDWSETMRRTVLLTGTVLYADRPRNAKKRGLSCNCLFGLGVPELVVIAGVTALVFGPKKLPEVGRSIGKTVKSFQQGLDFGFYGSGFKDNLLAAKEFESELKKEGEPSAEPSSEKITTVSEEEKQEDKVPA
ncbi:UNVERIFIED_CONTAM: Sec-independent protein translocase protein TATA, chloroplastic [Sesamum calycinum]|uniref:Sec-independent protein translocase protein TATA, chloroplastic n=1 Tax=Sesamum calycinum TaxID=2727403 RepID=A0AAW2SXB2_9LAMI